MRQPKKVKEQSKKSMNLNNFQISALAIAFGKEFITIERWANKNHYALSTPAAQQIIEQFKEIPKIPLITT